MSAFTFDRSSFGITGAFTAVAGVLTAARQYETGATSGRAGKAGAQATASNPASGKNERACIYHSILW